METEDFFQWYRSLDEEDKKLANGLIIISVTSEVEDDATTVGEMRKHIYDCFVALKNGIEQ